MVAEERYVALREDKWDELGRAVDAALMLAQMSGKDGEVESVTEQLRDMLKQWLQKEGRSIPSYVLILALLSLLEGIRLIAFKAVAVKNLHGGEVN